MASKSLKELVLELKESIPQPYQKKESEVIRKIRRKFEAMDNGYWERRMQIFERIDAMDHNTAEYEYLFNRTMAELLRDEIIYTGYQKILERPEQITKIKKEVEEKTKEYRLLLESLEGIREGLQLKIF